MNPRRPVEVPAPGGRLRVGLVSDTHLPRRAKKLPDSLLRRLARCQLILHAGDLSHEMTVEILESLAPLVAVAGNTDPPELAHRLGERREIEIGGRIRLGLTHGHLGRAASTPDRAALAFPAGRVAAVVFGHSHVPLAVDAGGMALVNPGSPTDPRGEAVPTFGLLDLDLTGPQPVLSAAIYPVAARSPVQTLELRPTSGLVGERHESV